MSFFKLGSSTPRYPETADSTPQNNSQGSNSHLPQPSGQGFKPIRTFEAPILLKQSPQWAYTIIWLIVLCTGGLITWAAIFKFDEAISAAGKLEPINAISTVQSPVGGVVKDIYIQEGEQVETNQVLLILDTRSSDADLNSTQAIRNALLQENQIYRAQLQGETSQIANLDPDKQALLRANQAEFETRLSVLDLEIQQLREAFQKTLTEIRNAEALLAIDQDVLDSVQPLYEAGGLPRLQLLRQHQHVDQRQATIDALKADQRQLEAAIQQAQKQQQLAQDLARKDILNLIADNEKTIATIERELARAEVNRQYEEIRSPDTGTIFDLQASGPGAVVNPSQALLKIVPQGDLVAQVFVTNRDIGFIDLGQPVDVRIDSFPFREFGDIKGEVIQIGSDVLAPDPVYPYYRFPVKIELDNQHLTLTGRSVSLQSGMAVTANIRTRKRAVLTIFTEMLTQNLEGLQRVR